MLETAQRLASDAQGRTDEALTIVAEYRAQLEAVTRERDAYCKAKQENDERFMRESDEAWRVAASRLQDVTDVRRLVAQAQADAAAMRVVLEQARTSIDAMTEAGFYLRPVIKAALSTSAGKPLLEAVEAAGKALDACREDLWDEEGPLSQQFRDALALLSPFRVGGGK